MILEYCLDWKGKIAKEKLKKMMNNSPKKLRKDKRKKYKLYVYRFWVCGKMSNAKPCGECTRWICLSYMLGVQYDVHYTDDDEKLKRFEFDPSFYMPPNTYY